MINRTLSLVLAFVFSSGAVRAQVTIRKTAANSNPALIVESFKGPESTARLFRDTLKRCDWFTVVSDGATAPYRLRAVYSAGPPAVLSVEVLSETGTRVAKVRQSTRSGETDWLVYRTVDALIRALFRNPGLCASRIAFVNGPTGRKEIGTCNFDGSGYRQLTRNGTISTEPSWGPGAATLVYTLYGATYTDVILFDLVNRRQRRLSQFPGLNAGADIDPGGKWAALCLSRDNAVELYLLRIRDGVLRRLTHDRAVESSPCWGPDGRTLCYVSDIAGRPHLYLLPVAGGAPVRLTPGVAEQVSPDWSPVSNRVCFATRRGGRYVLAVVDMADPAREARIIPAAPGDWEAPSWAPDGRHIVCTRTSGRGHALYIVDSWYGRAQPITAPGDVALPSWSDLF
ncbi:MAG: hypothetical protein GXP31_06080 [Kiritimatiellaeota bacterium]|nr:hypothetical protein [Kiritimatiellota bacterium]